MLNRKRACLHVCVSLQQQAYERKTGFHSFMKADHDAFILSGGCISGTTRTIKEPRPAMVSSLIDVQAYYGVPKLKPRE